MVVEGGVIQEGGKEGRKEARGAGTCSTNDAYCAVQARHSTRGTAAPCETDLPTVRFLSSRLSGACGNVARPHTVSQGPPAEFAPSARHPSGSPRLANLANLVAHRSVLRAHITPECGMMPNKLTRPSPSWTFRCICCPQSEIRGIC